MHTAINIIPEAAMISSSFAAYDIILILLSGAALLKAYPLWERRKFPQGFRMVLGLSILIFLRVSILITAPFTWQGTAFSPGFNLLSNAVDLLSMLVILWMWVFPEPEQMADLYAAVTAAAVAVLTLSQVLLQPSLLDGFTASPLLWELLNLLVLAGGAFLLVQRKPNQYENGLLMAGIFASGLLLGWLIPNPESHALDSLQLAQLAGYPLLLIMVNRFDLSEGKQQILSEIVDEKEKFRRRTSIDISIMRNIQGLFQELKPSEILYQITRCTSEILLSDLALIIDTPDQHGKVRIIAGYDLIRQENLQAIILESKSIPLLSNYVVNKKMLHLPASSTSRDLSQLAQSLQLTSPGHLLAAPIQIPGANRTIGLVLLSPYSNRPWTQADQEYLKLLTDFFTAAFRHHLYLDREEPDQVKETIRELSSKLTKLTKEKKSLHAELSSVGREAEKLRWQKQHLQDQILTLKKDQGSLVTHFRMLTDLAKKETIEAYQKYLAMVELEIKEKMRLQDDGLKEKPEPSVPEEQIDPPPNRYAKFPDTVEQVIENLQPIILEKDLTTEITMPESMPSLLMSEALFEEILTILLTNAVEETQQDGEITIRTKIYQEDESFQFAHIKIVDQGEGFNPEDLNQVLSHQLSDDPDKEITQQLTNLYVTKNLVENEGGRMWVESKPSGDTVVSLLLPLQEA